jgi:arylsulfatase A-like enzyme
VAFPRIYSLAWLLLALGLGARLVPLIARHRATLRRVAVVSFLAAVAIVAGLGATLWVGDRIRQARENARALPPPGSPNILLIVMDTVAAGHLGLHGYGRSTSTTLAELAQRGIRFDSARSASSWTLPSHATMFTGRWLHELSVGWFTPLDRTYPTVAEYLGDRGYATAGFVANTSYCARDSGLARGFTHYEDHILPELTALKMAVLVNRIMQGFQAFVANTENWLESAGLLPHLQRLWQALDTNRKGAAVVNRELLDWLSHRPQQARPFFAFLNYFDAHYPYMLVPGRIHRFGIEPTESYQRLLIQHWWELDKMTVSAQGVAFAADAYDDCVADLDEQLGKLIDELDRRGVLKQTWVIVTSDHGESFGEHAGIFCHGKRLYETEVRVPLIVVPPGGREPRLTVKEAVSLRDMAATIVNLAGLQSDAPFPGVSLSRFWNQPARVPRVEPPSASPSLAEVSPNDPFHRDFWGVPARRPPVGAIKDGEWSYISQEGDVHEELFHLREDSKEMINVASDPAAQTILQQKRETLNRLTGGPLLPQRFND